MNFARINLDSVPLRPSVFSIPRARIASPEFSTVSWTKIYLVLDEKDSSFFLFFFSLPRLLAFHRSSAINLQLRNRSWGTKLVGTPLTILIKFSRSRPLIGEKWWNEVGKGWEGKTTAAANNSLPSFSSIHPLPAAY